MELGNLVGKASELLEQHADKVDAAVEKVGELAKEKLGHDDKVDMAVDKVKDLLPGEGTDAPPEPAPA
ncbi:MAG: antitoxin [Pseudonocardia sp.]